MKKSILTPQMRAERDRLRVQRAEEAAAKTYETGHCKPPVEHQFKPGESGCATGGWDSRRRRQAEETEAARLAERTAEAAEKAKAANLPKRLEALFTREVKVTIDGVEQMVPAVVAMIMLAEKRAYTDDASLTRYLKLAEKLGFLDKPVEKERVGVVVVGRRLSKEEWLKKARATKLPLDPMEGLPGYDAANKTLDGNPVNFGGGRGVTKD